MAFERFGIQSRKHSIQETGRSSGCLWRYAIQCQRTCS